MEVDMVEIYCGDGKGKTTAAVGLTVRAAGHHIPVLFVQFLKDDSSGEIDVLRGIDGVRLMHPKKSYGFVRHMTEAEKSRTRADYADMMERVQDWLSEQMQEADDEREGKNTGDIHAVVILDEVIHACNYGLLDEKALLDVICSYRKHAELVLTGRQPSEQLQREADYISVIEKLKHPFDKGITARSGIEF